jgi:hypothetical protein
VTRNAIEHRSAEYYGTTQLAQRSRSPSPTQAAAAAAANHLSRSRCPAGATTSSAAAAALATASAAGGFFGSLITRRLPVTPPNAAAAAAAAAASGVAHPNESMFCSLLGSAALTTSGVAAALLHSDLPQPISPTLVDPNLVVSTDSSPLRRLPVAVGPPGKLLARALRVQLPPIEPNGMNFPSVSHSPTIPAVTTRSPNGINFPKLNASPTRRSVTASDDNPNQPMRRLQTPVDMRADELHQLLVDQPALLVDEDDLHELGVLLPPPAPPRSINALPNSGPMETVFLGQAVDGSMIAPLMPTSNPLMNVPLRSQQMSQQMSQQIAPSSMVQSQVMAAMNMMQAPVRELPLPPNQSYGVPNIGFESLPAPPFNRLPGLPRNFHCSAPIESNHDWR